MLEAKLQVATLNTMMLGAEGGDFNEVCLLKVFFHIEEQHSKVKMLHGFSQQCCILLMTLKI